MREIKLKNVNFPGESGEYKTFIDRNKRTIYLKKGDEVVSKYIIKKDGFPSKIEIERDAFEDYFSPNQSQRLHERNLRGYE